MSTSPPSPPAKVERRQGLLRRIFVPRGEPGELVIYSHSNLFYWWPVWLLAFVMAGWTYYERSHMVFVPAGAVTAQYQEIETPEGRKRDQVKLPGNAAEDPPSQPRLYVSSEKSLGVVFVFTLLLVIAITNIPMRGLWSLLMILVIVMWVVIFAQLGLWGMIFARSQRLAIHMNMAGYLFIGSSLFIIWLVGLLFFDRQFYLVVTPGQVRVHLEIGGGEKAYDTTGMVFQKKRSDLFRHWVLGFGSGDLIIQPAASREHIDLPNVTFVAARVRAIEQRLTERKIVSA
jgi:hypothetical protein